MGLGVQTETSGARACAKGSEVARRSPGGPCRGEPCHGSVSKAVGGGGRVYSGRFRSSFTLQKALAMCCNGSYITWPSGFF